MKNLHYQKLKEWFEDRTGVLTALSGGVDSCLVAWAARQFLPKNKAIAIIGDSPSLKRRDLDIALDFCNKNDIQYELIQPRELDDPNYRTNPEDRCFWCKSSLYNVMVDFRDKNYPGYDILNGNNKSDWGDYRPGLKAADKFQAHSPLADCKMTKQDIRDLARDVNLKVWDKPASPCLSSRFPYGELITIEKLSMVEKAEDLLFQKGFSDVRVRYFGESARIEVPSFQVQALKNCITEVTEKLKSYGFANTEIDEEGLISGKLNRLINK